MVASTRRKRKRKTLIPRHTFLIEMQDHDGNTHHMQSPAKTKLGTTAIELVLKAAHVEKSIRLDGCGSTQRCAMAVCTVANKASFPHNVTSPVFVDWTYGRVFISSKLNKGGMPVECYAYEHNDVIGKLNDTVGGHQKLLRKLQEDGPMTIILRPYRQRSEPGRSGRDRPTTGARARTHAHSLRGAKLRSATAALSRRVSIDDVDLDSLNLKPAA